MTDTEFALWQHNPVTAAFLRYLDDQIALWRENVVDIVEGGNLVAGARAEGANIDVWRGKLVAVRDLRRLTLADLQGFYREALRDSQD